MASSEKCYCEIAVQTDEIIHGDAVETLSGSEQKSLQCVNVKNDVRKFEFKQPQPTVLVLGGGGLRGVGMLGALSLLDTHNRLERVHTIYATSIGAVIATLFIIGYSPFEIFHEAFTTKVNLKSRISTVHLTSLFHQYGLYDIMDFLQPVFQLIQARVGHIPTLQELKDKYHKTLIITTYDTTLQQTVYLQPATHPNLPIDIALKMTSSIPMLFTVCSYENHSYIDGGIADNFPLQKAMNDVFGVGSQTLQASFEEDQQDGEFVMGIFLDSKLPSSQTKPQTEYTIMSYIHHLIHIPSQLLHEERVQPFVYDPRCAVAGVEVESIHLIDFEQHKHKWWDMFDTGYKQLQRKFCKLV